MAKHSSLSSPYGKLVASSLEQLVQHCERWVATETGPEECWLQAFLDLESSTCRSKGWIQSLINNGYTLRATWLKPWSEEVDCWLGPRLYFGHQACFASQFAAILCSRLGSSAQQVPRWPAKLDSSLKDIARRGETLLLAESTTLHEACREYAAPANIPVVELIAASANRSLKDWLSEALLSRRAEGETDATLRRMRVSPNLRPAVAESPGPLADRMLVACADRVIAIHTRARGKLEQLIQRRLDNPAFPANSVFVHLDSSTTNAVEKSKELHLQWLERGAVGWYVPEPEAIFPFPNRCTARDRHSRLFVTSATAPLCQCAAADWKWLVHCTRGVNQLPDECDQSVRRRQRIEGACAYPHPLRTLHSICSSGRIKSFSHLNRAGRGVVSFSARPILDLLQERRYQSHLQRWNWESYGLLVSREALVEIGCRPVIYGTDTDYAELAPEQKAYFQPLGTKQDWSKEEEWRLLGDLNLARLPPDAIRLFVPTQREAAYLAAMYDWTVLWVESVG